MNFSLLPMHNFIYLLFLGLLAHLIIASGLTNLINPEIK